VARSGKTAPQAGHDVVLIDFDGTPTLPVRLTKVREVRFGDITPADIAVDGSPARDLAVRKPMHTAYWNALLKPFDFNVCDDMPVWVEAFELLYSR
jgi:uncharacterized protein YhfF